MASRSHIHMPSASGLPELVLENWPPQLEDSSAASIAEVLTSFVVKRRWYRSKARHVASTRIYDVVTAPGGEWSIILLEFEYDERDREVYLCTVAAALAETADRAFADHAEFAIARIALPGGSRGILYDAIGTRAFSDGLLDAIAGDAKFEGAAGLLSACRTSAFHEIAGTSHPNLPARVSKAEQSNSSILYGDRFILKIFRKLDAGINPELEIGRFLTERGFRHSPAVAGHIEYLRDSSAPMPACILQQFVPNQGDAWEFTLQSAHEFYARNLDAVPPRLVSEHPMEGDDPESAALARRLIGEYVDAAQLLARRTAELHIVLTAPDAGPEFAPEPFTDEFRDALHRRFVRQLDLTLELIRAKRASFPNRVANDSNRLLQLEPRMRHRFQELCENPIHALRIRHHGDYHLGQVLYTGNDFAIIDFEGEPARSLEERRMKRAAMRDVAGMLRSFQYAAYSALPGEGVTDEDRAPKAEAWADYWNASVGQAFLRSYLAVAAGHAFIPQDGAERRILLDAFLLEKALYEIAYELNNRPPWVRIPLRGILSLMP